MAKTPEDNQSQKQTNVNEKEALAQGELLGKAMQGMLKDAFAQSVVNAVLGEDSTNIINQSAQQKLQSLLSTNSTITNNQATSYQDDNRNSDLNEIKKHLPHLELYTQDELKAIKEHIEKHFGPIYLQVEDSLSDHIRCDIEIIKSKENASYNHGYLVTRGMGAHKMPIPKEFAPQELDRAELFIALANNWPIESELPEDSWPIYLLNALSRLPFVYDSWMAQGHIISFPKDENYAPGTDYAGAILIQRHQEYLDNDTWHLHLSEDKKVNFYQVVLLYAQEIAYAEQYSARTLMKLMDKSAYICSKNRPLSKLRKPINKSAKD